MMTRQLCGINHYNKSNFTDKHILALLKSKRVELGDKMEAYFSHHLLAFWTVALVGIPIGILLAVGVATTIFGLIILGIMSLM